MGSGLSVPSIDLDLRDLEGIFAVGAAQALAILAVVEAGDEGVLAGVEVGGEGEGELAAVEGFFGVIPSAGAAA